MPEAVKVCTFGQTMRSSYATMRTSSDGSRRLEVIPRLCGPLLGAPHSVTHSYLPDAPLAVQESTTRLATDGGECIDFLDCRSTFVQLHLVALA
ncbi:menaquinone-specific isochorismate synthase [Anopheles sinensis]|uniref:Menaquinone-specific isochorismate synthase n=1 Tax=Anopheles sinensis TaxID=74873 RepID=A0A084WFW7_ANOSI|nr:menaquinone-specific isochorismate synthase [Anopheles sinensis]